METLRYYERRGLLPEPNREPSGHRRYDEETVRFLRAIKEAQAVGFTLAEIGEYLRAATPLGLSVRGVARADGREDRRDRLAHRGLAADARGTRARRRLRVRLARPLHVRRGVPRPARPGRRGAAGPARHERGERRQHLAPDHARRRGPAVAGRSPRGARPGGVAAGAAPLARGVPLGVRLGQPPRDSLVARAKGSPARRSAARGSARRAVVRARPVRPAAAARRARARA